MKKTINNQKKNHIMTIIKNLFLISLVIVIVLSSCTLGVVDISFDTSGQNQITLTEVLCIYSSAYKKSAGIYFFKIKIIPILIYLHSAAIVFLMPFIIPILKLFFFIILVYVFVKSLLTNFYVKHFKFCKIWNTKFIMAIWEKRKAIAPNFIILLLVMFPVRVFIRMCILVLINFNNDIVCSILIILLSLPFVYYFSNIIGKYLKKSNIEKEDYLFFNDYVIKNMNLYNIIFIISTFLFIKYYLFYYLAIIILLLVLLISCLPEPPSNPKMIHLRASPPITTSWIALIGTLSVCLADGANQGYNNEWRQSTFILDKETEKLNYGIFKKVEANNLNTNNGSQDLTTSVNWIHKNISDPFESRHVWLNGEQMLKIARSPILRMVYTQKKFLEFGYGQPSLNGMAYVEQSVFSNDKFIGSVGRVKGTLIVNFIKADADSRINTGSKYFLPTHYVADDRYRPIDGELRPIELTLKIFEEKFGIFIANKSSITNIMTFTETERLGNKGLVKIFRPSIYYTDLTTRHLKIEEYFQCSRTNPSNIVVTSHDFAGKYLKIRDLKLGCSCPTPVTRVEHDIKLNELYYNYFKTRLFTFKSNPNLKVEPIFSENCTQKEFLHKCTANGLSNMVFFREDDYLLYNNFRATYFVDMAQSRERLLSTIKGGSLNYAVCANQITMEFLLIENPHVDQNPLDSPQIFSIIDFNNAELWRHNGIHKHKQTFNILNKYDGETLTKVLNHN